MSDGVQGPQCDRCGTSGLMYRLVLRDLHEMSAVEHVDLCRWCGDHLDLKALIAQEAKV